MIKKLMKSILIRFLLERGNSRAHGKLEKNYEEMATRVCKMESTIQSLKTGLRGVEAERLVF